jgi:hypothetical protein
MFALICGGRDMAGKSPVVASEEQQAALRTLVVSRDRGEADRARAVLLTLSGWTSPARRGRGARDEPCTGTGPCQSGSGAESCDVIAGSARCRPTQLDAGAPHWRDRGPRGRHHLQIASVQGAAQKKFRWRQPRHTLKGRQDADAVDRVGLRLALQKAQAEAGDILLLFADESEALTHPYLARAWAKCGADLRVQAPGQAKKVAMMGALDHTARKLIVHTSRTKRSCGDCREFRV